jgi:hypothetical protein
MTQMYGRKWILMIVLACSYIRHLMEGFALVLSDDYEFGAMDARGREMPQCKGDGQFDEKVCRLHVPNQIQLCNNTVTVNLESSAWPILEHRHLSQFDAVFWGAGRHPVDGNYTTRYGVHDAATVLKHKLRVGCNSSEGLSGTNARVYWVTSHARLKAFMPDESYQHILKYNTDMTSYVGERHVKSFGQYHTTALHTSQLCRSILWSPSCGPA